MRYWFDTKNEELQIGRQIKQWEQKGDIKMVEKGDPYEQVKTNLLKIREAPDVLREVGINAEVMESYIYDKTKVSKSNIKQVLWGQQQFFKKMGLQK